MEADSAGQIIRRLREEADLAQEEVGLALRVTAGAVSQWENGRIHPRRATAIKLDRLLGADGEIIAALGYSELPIPSAPATAPAADLGAIDRRLDEIVRLLVAALPETTRQADDAGDENSETYERQVRALHVEVRSLRKSNAALERSVAAREKSIAALEAEVRRLRAADPPPLAPARHPRKRTSRGR